MLREKFCFHLKREPSQTLESWVLAIKKLAAECKFPPEYMNQAVKDKLTFLCMDEAAKSKLYDIGSDLTLDRAIKILYQLPFPPHLAHLTMSIMSEWKGESQEGAPGRGRGYGLGPGSH